MTDADDGDDDDAEDDLVRIGGDDSDYEDNYSTSSDDFKVGLPDTVLK